MSFPRYPAYKDSGVEWLGEVPGHWGHVRVKHLFAIGRGRVISLEDANEAGTYPVYSSQTTNDGCLGYIETFDFDCDQITWTTDGANAGTVFLRRGKHNCTNVCGTLQVKNDAEFDLVFGLHYLTFATQFYKRPDTNGAKIMNGEMAEVAILVPPLPEQTKIAAFLDRETAKIDALVAEQRRLMALLKEKRQAVISHAVTRGLNPHAPMKPSGIEWLGDVPVHWDAKRLRDVANLNPSKSEIATMDRDTLVSFLPMAAIGEDGTLNLESEKPVRELESGYTYFRDGDVTIAKITPCYENGKGALMRGLTQGVGFGTTELIVVRPKPEESCGEFLHSLFVSTVFRNIGESHMYGAGGQKRVPDDFVQNFATGFPPVSEQIAINAFLEAELVKFDTLTTEAGRAIDLLQERRTALISAAVTGQIDVRGVVQSL